MPNEIPIGAVVQVGNDAPGMIMTAKDSSHVVVIDCLGDSHTYRYPFIVPYKFVKVDNTYMHIFKTMLASYVAEGVSNAEFQKHWAAHNKAISHREAVVNEQTAILRSQAAGMLGLPNENLLNELAALLEGWASARSSRLNGLYYPEYTCFAQCGIKKNDRYAWVEISGGATIDKYIDPDKYSCIYEEYDGNLFVKFEHPGTAQILKKYSDTRVRQLYDVLVSADVLEIPNLRVSISSDLGVGDKRALQLTSALTLRFSDIESLRRLVGILAKLGIYKGK